MLRAYYEPETSGRAGWGIREGREQLWWICVYSLRVRDTFRTVKRIHFPATTQAVLINICRVNDCRRKQHPSLQPGFSTRTSELI